MLDQRKVGRNPNQKIVLDLFPVVLLREEKHFECDPATILISLACFCFQLSLIPFLSNEVCSTSAYLPVPLSLTFAVRRSTLNSNSQCFLNPDHTLLHLRSHLILPASCGVHTVITFVTNKETEAQRGEVIYPQSASTTMLGCEPRHSHSGPICLATTLHCFSGRNET